MRFQPVIVVPVGLSITAISASFLYLHFESRIHNRLEYQSWIPFLIGFMLALAVGLWPVNRFCSRRSRLIVRSLVFTFLLAPTPYGPEGTMVPALLAMIFPPFIMLFLAPVGPLLTFLSRSESLQVTRASPVQHRARRTPIKPVVLNRK